MPRPVQLGSGSSLTLAPSSKQSYARLAYRRPYATIITTALIGHIRQTRKQYGFPRKSRSPQRRAQLVTITACRAARQIGCTHGRKHHCIPAVMQRGVVICQAARASMSDSLEEVQWSCSRQFFGKGNFAAQHSTIVVDGAAGAYWNSFPFSCRSA